MINVTYFPRLILFNQELELGTYIMAVLGVLALPRNCATYMEISDISRKIPKTMYPAGGSLLSICQI